MQEFVNHQKDVNFVLICYRQIIYMRTSKKNKSSLKQQIKPFVTLSLRKIERVSHYLFDKKRVNSLQKNTADIYLQQCKIKKKNQNKLKLSKSKSKSKNNNQNLLSHKCPSASKKSFPFEAIKFKQKNAQVHQTKIANQSFINHNKQNFNEQMNVPSRLVFHPRLTKYTKYTKQKNEIKHQNLAVKQVHNVLFHEAVKRIFKNLDIFSRGTISQANIGKRISESALYFLGGAFQKIKNQKLILNIEQFIKLCDQIYVLSSKEDIKNFIYNILQQNAQNFQSQSINEQDLSTLRNIEFKQFDPKNKENQIKMQHNTKNQMQSSILQQKIVFKNKKMQFLSQAPLSFENKQNSIISFRRQSNSYKSKDVDQSQYESAKFALQGNTKTLNLPNSSIQLNVQRTHSRVQNNNSSEQKQMHMLKRDQNQQVKLGHIRKNRLDQINNLRTQILKDMKNLKQMNTQNLSYHPKTLFQIRSKSIQFSQSIKPLQDITRTILINQQKSNKISLVQQQKNNRNQLQKSKLNRNLLSNSKWINNSQKLSGAFSDLEKVREQFKEQKKIIQSNQKQREKYFNDQIKKINSFNCKQKQQKDNDWRVLQSLPKNYQQKCYQKNIQRLSRSINLNSSLQRTKKQISLVQSRVTSKNESHSAVKDKNNSLHKDKGLDKIQKLSEKIQQYLQRNIIKMEKSKEARERTVFV